MSLDVMELSDEPPVEGSTSNDSQPSCITLCKAEINPCQPWFPVADSSGREISVQTSFGPSSKMALLWKLAVSAWTLFNVVYTWVDTTTASFYLAYLSYWCLLAATAYLLSSLYLSVKAASIQQPPDSVSRSIKIAWILFSIAAHAQFLITVLFWLLVFDSDTDTVTYLNFMPHGGTLILVWIDGLIVNRIPVRWTHWWGAVLPFEALWLLWSVLQSVVFNIGNRNENDMDENDDSIYEALDWKNDASNAAVLSIVVLFVVGPAVYALLWLCSWYTWPCCCRPVNRRYLNAAEYPESKGDRPTTDVEDASIFAKVYE